MSLSINGSKPFSFQSTQSSTVLGDKSKVTQASPQPTAGQASGAARGGAPVDVFESASTNASKLPRDESAEREIAKLKASPGPISGQQMFDAISKGIADGDEQSAKNEFALFNLFAHRNESKLSPEAKKVMNVYRHYARYAQSQGSTTINDFNGMLEKMKKVANLQ